MNILRLYIYLLIISYSLIFSQNYQQRFGSIPVIINGVPAVNPFNGGINAPRFQMADIDGDNDLDLFIYDKDTLLYYYRNDGNQTLLSFTLITKRFLNLYLTNWFYFADIDNDGDYDMFIGRRDGRITFYRNTGSASSSNFVFVTDDYAFINVSSNSVPAFADINADGDKDLFVGNIKGGIYYYENLDVIDVKQIKGSVPQQFKIYQNYPNPFNPNAKIHFEIPLLRGVSEGRGVSVKLFIYDITGKEIITLVNSSLTSGTYEVEWNASNNSSGIYFYVLKAGQFTETKRLILLK